MTATVPSLLPGQPELEGGPVFREPWEAHAFAMASSLMRSERAVSSIFRSPKDRSLSERSR